MNLIEFKNVCLGYDGKVVLDNINFSIKKGDFLTIVGPNGSGKSTLIKGLLGLLPPMKGKITYPNIKKNFIGYMPQITKVDGNFPASVYEIVLSGCLNRLGNKPFYGKKEKELVIKNLDVLKILDLKNKKFSELSGGQRQKVLLARCLCSTSKLLILDEPSNNLDYNSKLEIYDLIKQLNKEEKITVILITHDLDKEDLLGNKVISLKTEDFALGDIKEYGLND